MSPANAIREGQGDGKELGGQHDVEAGEEDGMLISGLEVSISSNISTEISPPVFLEIFLSPMF